MTTSCKLFDLPPVGETNHSLGTCYCHLCTCGEHICPGERLKTANYLRSSLKSSYRKEFTKKKGIASEPYLRGCALNSGQSKIDFKTMNQKDFVQFDCGKTPSARYDKKDFSSTLKFTGVSQYQTEYPNWGNYEFINMKTNRSSLANNPVKFNPMTTYNQNYISAGSIPHTPQMKKESLTSPLPIGNEFSRKTMAETAFRAPSKEDFAERAENKNFGILPLDAAPITYRSSYAKDYSNKETPVILKTKRDLAKEKLFR